MEMKTIKDYEFWFVGALQLKRTPTGGIYEYSHPLSDVVKKNRYADGPFGQFNLASAPPVAGVYAIFIDDELQYIGECEDLYRRFGPTGYGQISPRNCHHDGQSTNCKLNSRVLAAAKNGRITNVWFHHTDDRKAIEARLISALNPPWNGRMESFDGYERKEKRIVRPERSSKVYDTYSSPKTEDFRVALRKLFAEAEQNGEKILQVRSGDLHKYVGGYPSNNHRMPCCCDAMLSMKELGDRVVNQPSKGKGANLIIEYKLPKA